MKEVKKYVIINSVNEDAIRSVGINRWMVQHKWYFIFVLFTIVAFGLWVSIDDTFVKSHKFISYTFVGYLIAIMLYTSVGMQVIGKKFFNKVKDLPEPIDLREVK